MGQAQGVLSIERVIVLVGVALGIAGGGTAAVGSAGKKVVEGSEGNLAAITVVEEPVDGGAAEFSPNFQLCFPVVYDPLVKNCVFVSTRPRGTLALAPMLAVPSSKVISGRPKSRGKAEETEMQSDGRWIKGLVLRGELFGEAIPAAAEFHQ